MKIEIRYGSDMVLVEMNEGQASAPILIDGSPSHLQTADARHDEHRAVVLVCEHLYGPVFETRAEARAAGYAPMVDNVTILEDLEYEIVG